MGEVLAFKVLMKGYYFSAYRGRAGQREGLDYGMGVQLGGFCGPLAQGCRKGLDKSDLNCQKRFSSFHNRKTSGHKEFLTICPVSYRKDLIKG